MNLLRGPDTTRTSIPPRSGCRTRRFPGPAPWSAATTGPHLTDRWAAGAPDPQARAPARVLRGTPGRSDAKAEAIADTSHWRNAALAVHLMTNTALTGATYDIDGGEQVLPG